MLALLASLQLATPSAVLTPAQDTMPVVTLAEALERATRFDPDYVAAAGQVDNAEWARRNAITAFINARNK